MLLDFQRICSSVGGNPDAALHSAGENRIQLHQGVSRGAATCPKYPHQPCAEVGQGPGLAQQPLAAFISHPQPLPPQLSSRKAAAGSCTR